VDGNGQVMRATTVNMCGEGVLLHFEEQPQLEAGDRVTCDFKVSHGADKPLPYWGVGQVIRVGDGDAAIEFRTGVLSRAESEGDAPAPSEHVPDVQRLH
jgi:hypothetical protein